MPDPHTKQWAVQRKFPRFQADQRLVIKMSGTTYHGRTRDISEGGVGATVAGDIPMGTFVELELMLPGSDDLLRLHSEVRYRQGFQYGFRFLHPSDKQVEIIRRAIRQLQPV